MGSIIERADRPHLELMCRLLPYNPTSGLRGIIHRKGAHLLAVTGFDNWTENSVFLHVWSAGPKAWSRLYLQEIFRYCFEICNKGLAIAITQGDNARTLEFCRRVGFVETHRIRDGWKLGTDLVIQEMRREECRWLRRMTNGNSRTTL
jgi:RimJ/RimL family protein N-acetyltransferase